MRWRRTGRSQIEDRRGQGRISGMGGLPIGGLGGGVAGVIGLVLFLLLSRGGGGFDIDPGTNNFPALPGAGGETITQEGPDPDADLVDFLNFVVEDIQASWQDVFAEAGQTYEPTKLVLFDNPTQTGCGVGSPETGPFYCPADGKMYLELGFFRVLSKQFGAPGDFAQAYVIAHEAGHHVQNLLGIEEDVRREQRGNRQSQNELSVRMELQADCFAGVWAHSAFEDDLLESGDLQEGLEAAAAVGDDRIQRQQSGRVDPHTWTHGSSEQRMSWFQRGFDTGSPDNCDTFSGNI